MLPTVDRSANVLMYINHFRCWHKLTQLSNYTPHFEDDSTK